jgi:hypothetical protein
MKKLSCWFIIVIISVAGMCGCRPSAGPENHQPEYTNTITGELKQQEKIADFAYEYGKSEAVIAAEREKFGKDYASNMQVPVMSQTDMEQQVAEIFWNLQTNSAAFERANNNP